MDSAYDAPEIRAHSRALGHVPLIEPHPRTTGKEKIRAEARRQKRIGLRTAEHTRYQERRAAERGFANFKDNFAGRMIRVRGPDKVACHVMFSIVALSAIQIMRLVHEPPRRVGQRPTTPANAGRTKPPWRNQAITGPKRGPQQWPANPHPNQAAEPVPQVKSKSSAQNFASSSTVYSLEHLVALDAVRAELDVASPADGPAGGADPGSGPAVGGDPGAGESGGRPGFESPVVSAPFVRARL